MEKLALFGGDHVFNRPLNRYNIGDEELKAATDVLKTGALSPFLGDWKDIPNVGSFYGGTKVREFESAIKESIQLNTPLLNSWTSGLVCAVGAIGIEPGDEVIIALDNVCFSNSNIALVWNTSIL